MFQILPAQTPRDMEQARELLREYAADVAEPRCFVTFETELASLPGEYAPPDGRLYLARAQGELAGCVAMRRQDEGSAEMKRLYVRPPFRGCGLGRTLAEAVIVAAREQGYARVVLDTLPTMREAIALYRSLGFRATDAYSAAPTPGAVFFELSLS